MNDSNVYKCSELTRKTRGVAPLPNARRHRTSAEHNWYADHSVRTAGRQSVPPAFWFVSRQNLLFRDVLVHCDGRIDRPVGNTPFRELITICAKLNLTAMAATVCRLQRRSVYR